MCLVARRQNQITNPETIALTKIEFVSHPSNEGSGPRFSRLGACSEMTEARQRICGIGDWWGGITAKPREAGYPRDGWIFASLIPLTGPILRATQKKRKMMLRCRPVMRKPFRQHLFVENPIAIASGSI